MSESRLVMVLLLIGRESGAIYFFVKPMKDPSNSNLKQILNIFDAQFKTTLLML